MVGKASIPTKEDPTVRRSHFSPDKLLKIPVEGVETVYDVWPYMAKLYGNKRAAAYRDIVKIVEEEKTVKKDGEDVKKTWKYFEMTPYKYLTYEEMFSRINNVASGLRHLGVEEKGRVGIYADTAVNWQIFANGATRALACLTTSYPTLGPVGLAQSVTEPEVTAMFTNGALLKTLWDMLKAGEDDKEGSNKEGGGKLMKIVVYDGECKNKSLLDNFKQLLESRGGHFLTLDELLKVGSEHPGDFSKRPDPEDLFCIMYTSGSSGTPKGVMLTHNNIISSLAGTFRLLKDVIKPGVDTFLAFLPLSHILEMLVEFSFYFMNLTIGYGTVKTLTDASVRNCEGDLKAFKPSVIVGVPAVFETIRKGIMTNINKSGAVKKNMFNFAYMMKRMGVPVMSGVADAVVFSKVKEQTGGKLRIAMNGGSGISKATQEFLNNVLLVLLQGYGLTETCGMCTVLTPEHYMYGSVGVPVPSIEIKLLDYPDAGYLTTNKLPQGEVLLRGGSVTKGYYKRPDLDEEAFKDGWFRTGDIGQWNANGTLTLIDRIKNLVKLSSGEYVALEKLESAYKTSDFLANICVYADGDCTKPMAMVTLHEANVKHFLDSQGIHPDGELEKDEKVKSAVLKAMLEVGQKGGLKGPEMLSTIFIDGDEWTPESGLLTAAQKLNRSQIKKKFEKQIEEEKKKQSG